MERFGKCRNKQDSCEFYYCYYCYYYYYCYVFGFPLPLAKHDWVIWER